jgi:hypothetical protein
VSLTNRLLELKKSYLKLHPFTHLTPEELRIRIKGIVERLGLAERYCPNCIGCNYPELCLERKRNLARLNII